MSNLSDTILQPGGMTNLSSSDLSSDKTEKFARIVHQDAPEVIAVVAHDLPDPMIEELAVVGHLTVLHIGMRPIGAGDDAAGKLCVQRARERQHLAPVFRLARTGQALWARQLGPAIVFIAKELKITLEFGIAHTVGDDRNSHVIENNGDRNCLYV